MKNFVLFIGTKLLAEVDELPKGSFLNSCLLVYSRKHGWGFIGSNFHGTVFIKHTESSITPEMRSIALLLGGS